MNDVSVLLEHVDFLNGLDGLDVHLLECGLEFLVVRGGGLVDALGLAAGSTFASAQISISSPLVWWFGIVRMVISGGVRTLLSGLAFSHNCIYQHFPAISFKSHIVLLLPPKKRLIIHDLLM